MMPLFAAAAAPTANLTAATTAIATAAATLRLRRWSTKLTPSPCCRPISGVTPLQSTCQGHW